MKAIIKKTAGEGGLFLEDIPIPAYGDDQVLVKVKKTAICGTDVHIYNWDAWAKSTIKPPLVIGHEFVGEVCETGKNVTNIKPGQIVVGEGHIVCGKCRHCITGFQHLCRQTVGKGVNIQGVFSEYVVFPAGNLWVCDPNISHDILSIMDPLGNAAHTALSFNVLGEDVLITGAGPIGLMAIPIIRRAGARHIVVTDVNPMRLKMAKQLGATTAVDVRTETLENVMKDLKLDEGFDVGLEMSGNASAFGDMINVMANGGKIAILGILQPDTNIDWGKVIFNSLTLKGIYGRQMYDTWYRLTSLLQTGLAEEIKMIITHHFDYRDFQKGFDTMRQGESAKVILNWEGRLQEKIELEKEMQARL